MFMKNNFGNHYRKWFLFRGLKYIMPPELVLQSILLKKSPS